MAILGVTLGLFTVFLPPLLTSCRIRRPLKSQKALICMLTDTALAFLPVFFCCLFYGDGGVSTVKNGLSEAAFVAAFVWIIFALFRYAPFGRLLKRFLTVCICGW